jgi:flagellar hook assembly protein FlgD
VPSEGHVIIDIFDINGRLVSTLLDENINSGYHNVTWDGVDANGLSVSAGLYICTFQVQGVTLSSKMVLMK